MSVSLVMDRVRQDQLILGLPPSSVHAVAPSGLPTHIAPGNYENYRQKVLNLFKDMLDKLHKANSETRAAHSKYIQARQSPVHEQMARQQNVRTWGIFACAFLILLQIGLFVGSAVRFSMNHDWLMFALEMTGALLVISLPFIVVITGLARGNACFENPLYISAYRAKKMDKDYADLALKLQCNIASVERILSLIPEYEAETLKRITVFADLSIGDELVLHAQRYIEKTQDYVVKFERVSVPWEKTPCKSV